MFGRPAATPPGQRRRRINPLMIVAGE